MGVIRFTPVLKQRIMETDYERIYKQFYSESEIKARERIKAKMGGNWKEIYWKFDLDVLKEISK